MIKKILMFGVLAVASFALLTAFEERTDEEIISEKLEAKKMEFTAMKEAECQEKASTMAMGMVDSIVNAKRIAIGPVGKAGKPKTTTKGSTTKPGSTPAPAPTTTPAPTPTDVKKDKMSGGTKVEDKKAKMNDTTNVSKKKAKMKGEGGK